MSPERVADFADQLDCPLIVDEAYADFAKQECLDLVQQNERVMVTRTLSKSYGLAGVGFGFLVAQPQVAANLQGQRQLQLRWACDRSSYGSMGCGDWLEDIKGKMAATQRMTERLSSLRFCVVPSQANFVWTPQWETSSTVRISEE